ncbi:MULTISPECIES: aromatic acid/H+ symport family MFS transporter [Pseudomonas]|uniref:MFS transporter n=1 Tax=Pseudomonas TaxID=286 RepID=UPI000B35F649|nr:MULTISPECIES: aromatic acid/H+ symport family MFS transporter [Pseudomonas]PMY60412.1 3-(3-hydroxy-phenyl)propionate transporter MhpT [Pseudomonas sp. FW305-25]PMY63410.1 3-(3-hydroxy-phenyl)propionate transporter MhpT [Pseudomonas sp. FW126-L8]PNA73797.1 3-(3-hydroxy-phenyl)propionate transporter MhpT [Pseudomonas sp. FW305-76]
MRNIDSNQLIDGARFNAFHWRVLFWCALIIIFDGYDLVIYGVVLPVLMQEWGLSPLQAGALGSYALFGMMFGALFFGTLSERIGCKKVIAICVVLFSGFTLLNGFTTTPTQFGICRFIAGLGIGGVMPNVVALMNEYAPKKIRSTLVAIMLSGYSVGGTLSAGLGIVLLPNFGWQAVFYVAAIPLLLLLLILRFLPESLGFLLRQGRDDEARQVLQWVEPGFVAQPGDSFVKANLKTAGAPVVQLFREGRALSTLMLWVVFFCCLLMVYALNSWLPKLMASAGYSLGSSLMFLLVLNLGAIFGAVGGGWIGDRLKLQKVLVAFFIVAAVSISLLGFKSPHGLLYALIAIAGATTIGTQILAFACVAQFYPVTIRSTGIGWASGIGRSGAIVGPLLGGALVSIELPLHYNFMAFAIPGAVAALAMCFVYPRPAKALPVRQASAPSL